MQLKAKYYSFLFFLSFNYYVSVIDNVKRRKVCKLIPFPFYITLPRIVNRMNARKIRLIRVSGYDLLGLSGCLAVSIPRRPFNGTLRIAKGRYTTRKRGYHLEETCRTWYGIT